MRAALFALLFVLAGLGGCTHTPNSPSAATEPRAPYPYGRYQHDVRVQVHRPKEQDLTLSGAMKYSKSEIVLIGLSPMGLTLFRLTDDLEKNELKTEYFVDSLQQADPQIRAFYKDLREAIVSKDPRTRFARNGTTFVFADLDEQKVPRTFYLANPYFEVTVKVASHEP